jgi:hypothetical protein
MKRLGLFLELAAAPAGGLAGGLLLLWAFGTSTSPPPQPVKPVLRDFVLGEGPAPRAPTLPDCKTVETEYGQCIEAGTYEGDPVLLLGHHPYCHVDVAIDMHGATMAVHPCADAGDSGALCSDRLPTTIATIVVHAPGDPLIDRSKTPLVLDAPDVP